MVSSTITVVDHEVHAAWLVLLLLSLARTRHVILGVKTWLSTLETVYLCVFRRRH